MGLLFFVLCVLAIGLLLYALSPAVSPSEFPESAILYFSEFKNASNRPAFKVATYNIGYAYGNKNNIERIHDRAEIDKNLNSIVEVLRSIDADIIALQEVDFDSDRSNRINQLDYLAKALRMPYAAYVRTWNLRYLPWPYWPPSRNYGRIVSGQAVLSRFPIRSQEIFSYEKPQANSFWYNWFYLDRKTQHLVIEVESHSIYFWNVHLEAFDPVARLDQMQHLAQSVRMQNDAPSIVAGDFNSVTSFKLGTLEKLEDRGEAIQSFMSVTGLLDAHSQESTSGQVYLTTPSWNPYKKIDHIFYSKELVRESSGQVVEGPGSDHLPVWAQFHLP